jgi:50S ribosomal protein L16 3-hydroxylase
MNIQTPLTLLGERTAQEFMRQYWQKRPLLVKQALPGIKPPVATATLRKMAKDDQVQTRLIWQEAGQWHLEHGPFARLPSARQPNWTLLLQSLDIHDDAASALMHRFDFIPAARLDDLMVSIASQGGGVGPHFDSYDVFLIQAAGKRHWKFGQQHDLSLVEGLPLKILKNFEPQQEAILEPGDMLYLPPHAAHDGVALTDDCMTLSVGFRAPTLASLAQGMLEAAAEQIAARQQGDASAMADPPLRGPRLTTIYQDPGQRATEQPGELPAPLIRTALDAVARVPLNHALAERYLGCWLTEPNALAVFEPDEAPETLSAGMQLQLDRRSRLLYSGNTLFINGELAPIRLQSWSKQLADERALTLTPNLLKRLTPQAKACLLDWIDSGWVRLTER